MKILAVDTATRIAGSAIVDESGVLAESWLNTGKTHSQKFLPMLQDMLKNAGAEMEDMDCFAVTVGPGSFTGLRIGIATVKGFVQILKKPLVGVVTLDALSRNLYGVTGLICPILDARKNEVYTALYREDSGIMKRLSSYRAVDPKKLLKELQAEKKNVTFLGDAVAVYRPLIEDMLGEAAVFAAGPRNFVRPSEVGLIGWEKYQRGELNGADEIQPLYLRQSEAEVKWEQSHGGCCL